MESKKVTIHDIAARLKMSASTVSRALSGNSRISKATIEKVKKTAVEMGYKPNALAASFRTGQSLTIGVIVPRINRHFFSNVIAGIEAITNPAGYHLIICQSNEDFLIEKESLETMVNKQVDGIIISVSSKTTNGKHIQSVIKAGVPVVFFDRLLGDVNTDYVINNNEQGGYEVTRHLIGQGYKNIVHFSGPLHSNIYADRCNGYKKAMKEAGFELHSDSIYEDVLTRNDGRSLALKMLADGNLPDAICSASDYSALGALLAFKENGIRIPEDIGISGFANEPFAELMEPGMTSLDQFGEEIGKSAAQMLIARFESDETKLDVNGKHFSPELIVRKSTTKNYK